MLLEQALDFLDLAGVVDLQLGVLVEPEQPLLGGGGVFPHVQRRQTGANQRVTHLRLQPLGFAAGQDQAGDAAAMPDGGVIVQDLVDAGRGAGADDQHVSRADVVAELRLQMLRRYGYQLDRRAGAPPGDRLGVAQRLDVGEGAENDPHRGPRQGRNRRQVAEDVQRGAVGRGVPLVDQLLGDVAAHLGGLLGDDLVDQQTAYPAAVVQEVGQVHVDGIQRAADAAARDEDDLRAEQLADRGVGQSDHAAHAGMARAFGDDDAPVGEVFQGAVDFQGEGAGEPRAMPRVEIGAGEVPGEPHRRQLGQRQVRQLGEFADQLHVLVHHDALGVADQLLADRLEIADFARLQVLAELRDDAEAGNRLAGVLAEAGEVDYYRSHAGSPRRGIT